MLTTFLARRSAEILTPAPDLQDCVLHFRAWSCVGLGQHESSSWRLGNPLFPDVQPPPLSFRKQLVQTEVKKGLVFTLSLNLSTLVGVPLPPALSGISFPNGRLMQNFPSQPLE